MTSQKNHQKNAFRILKQHGTCVSSMLRTSSRYQIDQARGPEDESQKRPRSLSIRQVSAQVKLKHLTDTFSSPAKLSCALNNIDTSRFTASLLSVMKAACSLRETIEDLQPAAAGWRLQIASENACVAVVHVNQTAHAPAAWEGSCCSEQPRPSRSRSSADLWEPAGSWPAMQQRRIALSGDSAASCRHD